MTAPVSEAVATEPNATAPARHDQWLDRLALATVALAILPIVVAAVRAISRDWLPIGDNALFEIRARDVFTKHHPLLGLWTSASISARTDLNHPGPLFFDLLAVPVRVAGADGIVAGVAMLNSAAVAGIAAVARRLGGARLVVAAMAMAAALAWTMGSELLYDPWQPHSMLLPFLCYLALVWAVVAGEFTLLPWAAAVASLVVQTHLGYAVLVPALALWAVAGVVAHERRARREGTPTPTARLQRVAVITALVLAVAWSQPLLEQFTSDGEGNLSRIVAAGGESDGTVGVVVGARFVASVAALPPWWGRPSFGDSFLPPVAGTVERDPARQREVPTTAAAGVGGVVLVALLAGLLAWARRRGDRLAAVGVATAACSLAVAWLSAAIVPIGPLGVAPHQVRWLWPITVFTTFVVAVTVARAGRARDAWRPPATAAFAAAAVALTLLNLPYHNQQTGPSADEAAIPVVRALDAQLDGLERYGTIAFDMTGLPFAEPFSAAVHAELQRRGIRFVVRDEGLVRQLGEDRRFDGDADTVMFFRFGADARDEVAGATRIAYAAGLTPDEQRELESVRADVTAFIADDGLPLSERGERAVARGDAPWLVDGTEVSTLIDYGMVASAAQSGFLDLDDSWDARFERFATLQTRAARYTVAVYVAPMPFGIYA